MTKQTGSWNKTEVKSWKELAALISSMTESDQQQPVRIYLTEANIDGLFIGDGAILSFGNLFYLAKDNVDAMENIITEGAPVLSSQKACRGSCVE